MIKAKEIINMAFSYDNGISIRNAIVNALKTEDSVTVDFDGIIVFTTMFFNACSGHFVLTHSLKWYTEKIKFINLNNMGKEAHKHSIENAENKRTQKKEESVCEITEETISNNT